MGLIDCTKGPYGMQAVKLDPEVLAFIQKDQMFVASESEIQAKKSGFIKCVDAPDLRDVHTYYEGYFQHGFSKTLNLNPRFGSYAIKPQIGRHLAAFLEALKVENCAWLADLRDNLQETSFVRGLFDKKRYFCDCAVQIHFGEEVGDDQAVWHVDLSNSFLHMAMAIRGSSDLLVAKKSEPDKKKEILTFTQTEGDVLISNPVVADHAIRYPQTTWDRRIIAVQCRLLLSARELQNASYTTDVDQETLEKDVKTVAEFIDRQKIHLPNFQEVLTCFERKKKKCDLM